MNPIIVIPARMNSERLPGKPLVNILVDPMIIHVWRRAQMATSGPVIVACSEQAIVTAIQKEGGIAILTRPDHLSGSDRVFEAIRILDPEETYDIVINVQGDLPLLESWLTKTVLTALVKPDIDITTLVAPLKELHIASYANIVKTVASFRSPIIGDTTHALYFSRVIVPGGIGPLFHHIGLYAYRRRVLSRFVTLPLGVLEVREKLEQLRALENGIRVEAILASTVPLEVNTQADLTNARTVLIHRHTDLRNKRSNLSIRTH